MDGSCMSNGETLVMDSVNISAKISSSSCPSRRQAAAAALIFRPLLASIYHRVCQNTVFFSVFIPLTLLSLLDSGSHMQIFS